MKRNFSLLILILAYHFSSAQVGGSSTYQFLNLSPDARITSLGGINVSILDHDINTQLSNPASLNRRMNTQAAFSTVIYPGGINFGNVSYGKRFNKIPGTFGFGLQYIAYGKFKETDDAANITGNFNAGEMNLYAGYGYQFGRLFSVGANAKFIYSQLGPYSSVGMAADLGVTINDTAHNITASIVAKNIGGQFKAYNKGVKESVPFDLQAGISFGFKGVPFRLHATFHHLTQWDIRYDNPADRQQDNLFTDTSENKPKKYIGDKLFRHVIIGVEFNIKKIVRIDVAYNHLRQQELKLATKRGVPGLSFGLGVRIRQFDFSYGFQPMAQGQVMNHFTFTVYTSGFVKKKTAPTSENQKI
ncbi:MAG: type IX secretion system protein PorQ [Chitinophagales bacterium]